MTTDKDTTTATDTVTLTITGNTIRHTYDGMEQDTTLSDPYGRRSTIHTTARAGHATITGHLPDGTPLTGTDTTIPALLALHGHTMRTVRGTPPKERGRIGTVEWERHAPTRHHPGWTVMVNHLPDGATTMQAWADPAPDGDTPRPLMEAICFTLADTRTLMGTANGRKDTQ